MSRLSQKEMMRDALLITERNLSSLIAARHSNYMMMRPWRDVCRKALGLMPYRVEADPDPQMLLVREILDQA